MSITLEQFSSQAHDLLKKEPGPAGREKVRDLLMTAVSDPEFVAKHLPDGTPPRKVLYEDPELGFAVLAHAYGDASESAPHDHGPSWAIYGQAQGETEMSEWECLQPATEEVPGKVRKVKTYTLKPGMAQLYNEGTLHSPRREGPTRLIRIEGQNMDGVRRLRYQAV